MKVKGRYLVKAAAALAMLALLAACGSSGDSTVAQGNNPGVPQRVELTPDKYLADTTDNIALRAKVIDGNGTPLSGVTVSFSSDTSNAVLSSISAVTNSQGVAAVYMKAASSSVTGFAIVEALVLSTFTSSQKDGIAKNEHGFTASLTDRKTIFFKTLIATDRYLVMSVDGDENASAVDRCGWDEDSDFDVFNNDRVRLRATLYDNTGTPIPNANITFLADVTSNFTFMNENFIPANTGLTNTDGELIMYLKTLGGQPFSEFVKTDTLNVWAYDDIGTMDNVGLFMVPVSVSQILWLQAPLVLESKDSSEDIIITANTYVAHVAVPNGTVAKFYHGIDGSCTCYNAGPGTACDSPELIGCNRSYVSFNNGEANMGKLSVENTTAGPFFYVICANVKSQWSNWFIQINNSSN